VREREKWKGKYNFRRDQGDGRKSQEKPTGLGWGKSCEGQEGERREGG